MDKSMRGALRKMDSQEEFLLFCNFVEIISLCKRQRNALLLTPCVGACSEAQSVVFCSALGSQVLP